MVESKLVALRSILARLPEVTTDWLIGQLTAWFSVKASIHLQNLNKLSVSVNKALNRDVSFTIYPYYGMWTDVQTRV